MAGRHAVLGGLGRAPDIAKTREFYSDVFSWTVQRGGLETTAVAEWYRFLAELGTVPGRAVRHDHHPWRLDLELADLSSERQLASVGLGPPRPGRTTWPPYQDIGERLRRGPRSTRTGPGTGAAGSRPVATV